VCAIYIFIFSQRSPGWSGISHEDSHDIPLSGRDFSADMQVFHLGKNNSSLEFISFLHSLPLPRLHFFPFFFTYSFHIPLPLLSFNLTWFSQVSLKVYSYKRTEIRSVSPAMYCCISAFPARVRSRHTYTDWLIKRHSDVYFLFGHGVIQVDSRGIRL
jgi:hypothetical protein